MIIEYLVYLSNHSQRKLLVLIKIIACWLLDDVEIPDERLEILK